jgi:hypothetical protein
MVLLLPDKAQRDAASRPLCYFCRKGIDEAEHIYGGCEVIVRARADFSRKISIPLDPTALLGGLSLRYPTSGAGPDVASVEEVGVRSSPPLMLTPPPHTSDHYPPSHYSLPSSPPAPLTLPHHTHSSPLLPLTPPFSSPLLLPACRHQKQQQ